MIWGCLLPHFSPSWMCCPLVSLGFLLPFSVRDKKGPGVPAGHRRGHRWDTGGAQVGTGRHCPLSSQAFSVSVSLSSSVSPCPAVFFLLSLHLCVSVCLWMAFLSLPPSLSLPDTATSMGVTVVCSWLLQTTAEGRDLETLRLRAGVGLPHSWGSLSAHQACVPPCADTVVTEVSSTVLEGLFLLSQQH